MPVPTGTVRPVMTHAADPISSLWPALAFLLAGVPLAALLERIGFFESVAVAVLGRSHRATPVLALWLLAAVTTVVLNLDTTIVLLTPLYLRIARRTGADPIALVAIPLLLASLASSVLPISNLTTLIVSSRFDLGPAAVFGHLALPCAAATLVGWLAYARRHPTHLGPAAEEGTIDVRALRLGGGIVAALLVGFVAGPSLGVAPWVVVLAADAVLVVLTRWLPWRTIPAATAIGVAALAAGVAVVVPADALSGLLAHDRAAAVALITLVGAGAANLVNNLPATLVGLDGVDHMSWGMWAWLLGVNTGAVLLPIGALANLLWLRIVRAEGMRVGLAQYVSVTVPIALPALVAAAAVLGIERLLAG